MCFGESNLHSAPAGAKYQGIQGYKHFAPPEQAATKDDFSVQSWLKERATLYRLFFGCRNQFR